MNSRLDFAVTTARKAAKLSLEYFQKPLAIQSKADDSPVTIADLEVEQLIRDEIRRQFPGDSILGEEQGATDENLTRWVIDPIDGTKSFLAGVPLFATLLSYEVEGVPKIGVCVLPALEEEVYAVCGGGCFYQGSPARVSVIANPSEATIAVAGHSSVDRKGLTDSIASISRKVRATRTWCDAYGHFLVAVGRVEAMIDPNVARHDISAMKVIVEEAGGRFTDLNGGGGNWTEALSTNQALHDWVLGEL